MSMHAYPAGDPRAERSNCGVGALVDLRGTKSHRLIEDGFRLLADLDHRGARGSEEDTGDGAGLLLQIPHAFFASCIRSLPHAQHYAVGQAFLPKPRKARAAVKELVERHVASAGLTALAWREVPTNNTGLGHTTLRCEPAVEQLFVAPREALPPQQLDTKLYVLRRRIENAARVAGLPEESFYMCSLSRSTIVYKGLLTSHQLESYYPDLSDPEVESALVLVHSRFSTNTLGAWHLAHPYRCLIHNGEINTLRGNLNWMRAREADLASERFGDAIHDLKPVTDEYRSDSAIFDNVLELLLHGGRDLPHALRMMIPEAWEKDPLMSPARRAFYDFHSALMEPWDGPALIVATDGERVAAILDRNGLRPCRYCLTRDNLLVLASETGVLQLPAAQIRTKARLRPGQLLLADIRAGRLVPEEEIFTATEAARYQRWLHQGRIRLASLRSVQPRKQAPTESLAHLQRLFGYTLEGLNHVLRCMAEDAKDPIGSMGNDAPPAALSNFGKPLFSYFQQGFAQVSNPPIDHFREALVTSLACHVGRKGNLLQATAAHCRQLLLDSPILDAGQLDLLRQLDRNGLRAHKIDISYSPEESLRAALARVCSHAAGAVKAGCELLILSDCAAGSERIPIPSLMAVGGVHHHLIRTGLRTRTALLLASGEPYLVHHFCTLVGYGADGIHPWLALQSIEAMIADGSLDLTVDEACARYRQALESGLLKVMSKMGISTLASYKGAQIFEAIGLDREVIDTCFAGTRGRVPGVGFEALERELVARHRRASLQHTDEPLEEGGDLYWRRNGESHQWNPYTIGKLQQAARTNDAASYRAFANAINEHNGRLHTLRGLLDFTVGESVPLEQVESCEAIMHRFATGSMSFGALSREAHEALAVAMRRIGGKSGSGEGGEQVERFGTDASCTMKQVASGRFGVTIDYLNHAEQIEIKMAQGSKPGEGGELPGVKVDEEIAAVRFTVPGVGLISPPPHHDIYSIEDLAQLIHDLKCANPSAEIHVKLVATGGVGTIAAGVAKARADAVLISGDSGGTGASLKTSIKSAGSPWELGLAETQQMLLANNLRSRIRVRVDGGLKTGRDVVIAALLGAEEFGFGTAPLVTLGCLLLRKCHCNTCSVGVATQDPALRARFAGRPEFVVNYLRFVAEEVRKLMAQLGFRTMDDMIGRVDRLCASASARPKGVALDLSELLLRPESSAAPRKVIEQNHQLDRSADQELIRRATPAIHGGLSMLLYLHLRNRDRAVGTMLSSVVTKARRGARLPPDSIVVQCTGSAGQSFGAFLACGIALHLTGDANDYVGKGLSGGRICIRVPDDAAYARQAHVIIGNVALYGATAGEAYFEGLAGERFAVRNSGAVAVVEGVGDHGCEYMTGGTVLILGAVGRNFAAGMSGGEAFVFDEFDSLGPRLNTDMVHTEPLSEERDLAMVRRLLENHRAYTGSAKAQVILTHWPQFAPRFVKVVPDAYAQVVARGLRDGKDVRPALPPRRRGAPESSHGAVLRSVR